MWCCLIWLWVSCACCLLAVSVVYSLFWLFGLVYCSVVCLFVDVLFGYDV